jgi:response regulator RpfG family c-di-GMP phosphodiesterase
VVSRILCVDDESDILEAVRLHLLGDEEIELVVFDDPIVALESLKSNPTEFSLALVDIMMPGMTGIEFMAAFKELNPRTVRVNMSSHADLELVLNALGSNQIYDFIRKPLTREGFLSTVKKALGHYGLRVERDALAKTLKEKNLQLEDWNRRLDEEVQRKTIELDLRDDLMQHLSGCCHLEDPYEVVRKFLKASVSASAQQIILAINEGHWTIKEVSEGLSLADGCLALLDEKTIANRFGPMAEEELRQWEQHVNLPAHSLAWGEVLQYRDGVVGLWMVQSDEVDSKEKEALSGFSSLMGLLLYDELTLGRIGELSEGLF